MSDQNADTNTPRPAPSSYQLTFSWTGGPLIVNGVAIIEITCSEGCTKRACLDFKSSQQFQINGKTFHKCDNPTTFTVNVIALQENTIKGSALFTCNNPVTGGNDSISISKQCGVFKDYEIDTAPNQSSDSKDDNIDGQAKPTEQSAYFLVFLKKSSTKTS